MSALLGVAFAAVFVALVSIGSAGLALFERLVPGLPRRISGATWVHAGLLSSPVVAAALGCVALAVQNPFSGCHCAAHGLHHPHLCLAHPMFVAPLALPSACLLAVWIALVAPRVVRLVREVVIAERCARQAARRPIAWVDGVAVRIVPGGPCGAFTVGALSPVIVFERSFWEALSPGERRAVAHHEAAHVARRDGLTLLVLLFCGALSPMPLAGRLLGRWRAHVESACDRHAAFRVGEGAAVAEALLAAEKARSGAPVSEPMSLVAALGTGAGSDLERRVVALLTLPLGDEREDALGSDLLAVAVLACGAGLLALLWPSDALHHAVETAAGLFAR